MDGKKPKSPLKNWVVMTGMAFQMGIIIALGVIFGIWLDGKFPNQYQAFTIIFSLLGVFAALYTVIKQVNNLNK
ncbi:MAG TPA: AtpZ/AtpI family protein [Leeuwenhoekiella sp.]|nr:AtpZ/AtpI family protein [Leeuwenhoekiella sp.]